MATLEVGVLWVHVATVTAVSAVNLTMLPDVVAWLWPTVAGTAVIAYYSREYGSG